MTMKRLIIGKVTECSYPLVASSFKTGFYLNEKLSLSGFYSSQKLIWKQLFSKIKQNSWKTLTKHLIDRRLAILPKWNSPKAAFQAFTLNAP